MRVWYATRDLKENRCRCVVTPLESSQSVRDRFSRRAGRREPADGLPGGRCPEPGGLTRQFCLFMVLAVVLPVVLGSEARAASGSPKLQLHLPELSHRQNILLTRPGTETIPFGDHRIRAIELISWIQFQTRHERTQLYASLILREEEVGPFTRTLAGSPLEITALHEYRLPGSIPWWSLHLRGSGDREPQEDHLEKGLRQIGVSQLLPPAPPDEDPSENVRKLQAALGEFKGEVHGRFLFLPLPGSSPGAADSTSVTPQLPPGYMAFQPLDNTWAVIGDIVTRVHQVGSMIQALYRNDLHLYSLAFDTTSEQKRIYFLHVGGTGDPVDLGSRVRTVLNQGRTPQRLMPPKNRQGIETV